MSRIEEIRKLEQAAAPPPWKAGKGDVLSVGDDIDETRWSVFCRRDGRDYFLATIENGAPGDTLETEAANAAFIAASREAVPYLLDAHDKLKERLRLLCRACIMENYGEMNQHTADQVEKSRTLLRELDDARES